MISQYMCRYRHIVGLLLYATIFGHMFSVAEGNPLRSMSLVYVCVYLCNTTKACAPEVVQYGKCVFRYCHNSIGSSLAYLLYPLTGYIHTQS